MLFYTPFPSSMHCQINSDWNIMCHEEQVALKLAKFTKCFYIVYVLLENCDKIKYCLNQISCLALLILTIARVHDHQFCFKKQLVCLKINCCELMTFWSWLEARQLAKLYSRENQLPKQTMIIELILQKLHFQLWKLIDIPIPTYIIYHSILEVFCLAFYSMDIIPIKTSF